MIGITKILAPVDFSEPSKRAVAYAAALAEQFHAKLILAHIVPSSAALNYAFPVESFGVEQTQYKRATQELQALLPADRAVATGLQTISKIGHVDEELLKIVEDEDIDLVVMGTHGRRSAVRWFMGSTTERLLRKVPVPVLTVGHTADGGRATDGGLMTAKHILYAADFPEHNPGMDYACALARAAGAQLTIVHVVEHLNLMYGAAEHITGEASHRVDEMRGRFREYLSHEVTQGLTIETIVLDGRAYEEILKSAGERGADMIILNRRSKGILERAFLGSTAERVVRLAHVPVLSVPAAE